MSDLQKYKKKRMDQDPEAWSGYDERLETFFKLLPTSVIVKPISRTAR
jgi:hypothetical protein